MQEPALFTYIDWDIALKQTLTISMGVSLVIGELYLF